MRILKWDLQIAELQTIEMPSGAEILTVQMQNSVPRIWALCEESESINPRRIARRIDIVMPRRIAIYGTGHPINENPGIYIATFQAGEFVFHVFEVTGS